MARGGKGNDETCDEEAGRREMKRRCADEEKDDLVRHGKTAKDDEERCGGKRCDDKKYGEEI
jgi:hypothetical protein